MIKRNGRCPARRSLLAGCALCAMSLASCDSLLDGETASDAAGQTSLNFTAAIVSAGVESKAAIEGTEFPVASTAYNLGLWVCEGEDTDDYTPAMTGYDNMLVEYDVTAMSAEAHSLKWTYNFNDTEHDTLGLRRGEAVDIYAYYPHQAYPEEGTFLPTAIPFTSGQDDWMYAEKVSLTADETNTDQVDVTLKFQHAMTCIQVMIKTESTGDVQLTGLKLTGDNLTSSGIIDIVNRTLTASSTGSEISVAYSRNNTLSTDSYTSFSIIMPAYSDYDDEGAFQLSFEFNGRTSGSTYAIPVPSGNAFQAGYIYTYYFLLDNYLHFSCEGKAESEWTGETIDIQL